MVADLAMVAVHNNAHWCDLMCRVHGLTTVTHPGFWASVTRSPDQYPDVVTLTRASSIPDLLAYVEAGPGCSVKDGFASVDLSDDGFEVLFTAEWLHYPASAEPSPSGQPDRAPRDGVIWRIVDTPALLERWAQVHGGGSVFHPALLADPTVVICAATGSDGELVAGAIGNLAAGAVGLSNVFADGVVDSATFAGVVSLLRTHFPQYDVVGYETGEDLTAAEAAGFTRIGPLRVWLRP